MSREYIKISTKLYTQLCVDSSFLNRLILFKKIDWDDDEVREIIVSEMYENYWDDLDQWADDAYKQY